MSMRLNRLLASAGLGSRRAVEELIRQGQVTVNGERITNLATYVQEEDNVVACGKRVRAAPKIYAVLNKPKNVVCSRLPQDKRRTVFDLLPPNMPRVFYVGRLDAESAGLLLLTNDGHFAQSLSHPSHGVKKVYEVELDRHFDFALVTRMRTGIRIESGWARVADVRPLQGAKVKVILEQGLNRQIRLMFAKLGYKVRALRRVAIGQLRIGSLKPGEIRMLSTREIRSLFPGVLGSNAI